VNIKKCITGTVLKKYGTFIVKNKDWRSSIFWKKRKIVVLDAKSFIDFKEVIDKAESFHSCVVEKETQKSDSYRCIEHCIEQKQCSKRNTDIGLDRLHIATMIFKHTTPPCF
jgi:hypothetical protein